MTLALVETRCHFCRRTATDLIGRLQTLVGGTHAGAFACDVPDREECVRIAYNRLRRRRR